MSNFEKSPTPLERLKADATYHDAQAADCEIGIKRLKKHEADLAANAENHRKLARETRAAIKTLEDAAWRATFDYAKPAFKYDFKVGDRVKRVSAIGYRCAVNVEGITGTVLEAYTGDDDYYALNVKWDVEHSELRGSHVQNVQPAFKYDFKVGQFVTHRDASYGCGIVSEAHAGKGDFGPVKVRPDSDPNNVCTWSAYNLTKIT